MKKKMRRRMRSADGGMSKRIASIISDNANRIYNALRIGDYGIGNTDKNTSVSVERIQDGDKKDIETSVG